jgi:hypothetical protein
VDLKTAIEGININSFVAQLHLKSRVVTPHHAVRHTLDYLYEQVYGESRPKQSTYEQLKEHLKREA